MLIIPSKPKTFYSAVKIKLTYRGKDLSLAIRPLDAEKEDELLAAAERHEAMVNPETRALQRVSYTDKNEYFRLLVDHVIADFSGIGGSTDAPWPVDAAHKVKLCSIVPLPGEAPIWKQVFDRAREMAASQMAVLALDAEAQEKN